MSYRSPVNFDYILMSACILLIVLGILFIYSSGINADGELTSNEYLRQIVWAFLGSGFMLAISLVRYDYFRDFSPIIYGVMLAAVLFTLVFGEVVNGARSWLKIGTMAIQPSEFMKIALILMLAYYMDRAGLREMSGFKGLTLSILIMLPPMFMVLMQPDLGTAMVYFPIALFMLYAAGAKSLHLLFIVGMVLLAVIFAVLPEWEKNIYPGTLDFFIIFNDVRYFAVVVVALSLCFGLSLVGYLIYKRGYLFVICYIFLMLIIGFLLAKGARWFLKDYQMMRLIVFLDPYIDPRGAGWNIIQSMTAVGAGGFSGMGFLQGTQSHYQYLPQQSTDFLFSILSEEWGFLGGFLVTILYSVIIVRGIIIATQAKDKFGSYVAIGVVAMLFFHYIVNVGMTIGIMPITGIPLLFLSYGGSSLWTAMIAMGLLMSVSHHRYKY